MMYAVGSLVKARGREWVVLPESDEEMLIVRPLGGTDEEVAGIFLPLEGASVVPAQFELPDPTQWGDYRSCRLLRDAVRLGFRSSAGPFRSFAHIAVEPRPYQLVPLLMALRLDPVRLLIADDVGIGKTVEAGLIARELLDRREVDRLAVLCPPHLAEQWQAELQEKFHIDAVLVLSSTAAQLERHCRQDESLFQHYPFVIISIDFIKADKRRAEFVDACPDLVIVDEAHTCAFSNEARGGRHQRYQLLTSLAARKERHLILVTATPHSGDEEAFRSLLTLLDEDFKQLPDNLSGRQNEKYRQQLAEHFVQRRRADIQAFLKQETQLETPFPGRDDAEKHYILTPEYRRLVDRIMSYARETVQDTSGGRGHQRVRWWSVLALLRSMASSPAAAATTLRNRAQVAGAESESEADAIGRRTVLDLTDSDTTEGIDITPGSDFDDDDATGGSEKKTRQRLLAMAREAESLQGAKDAKLQQAMALIGQMVKDGYQPIVFCRFIPTADYVAQELRKFLPKTVEIAAVTGVLPPTEREQRVEQLAQSPQRVLVCTDCLSEGINLQEYFNAVFHYDLSWNPTRHEQREGRVDRFGQAHPKVRVLTYYGKNNIVDSIVLDVLINKHRKIRSTLGISVPVPLNTEQVVEALFESVLTHEEDLSEQQQLPGFENPIHTQRDELFKRWDVEAEREQVSRSLFAHHSLKTDEVRQELEAVRSAIGIATDVSKFTSEVLQAYRAFVSTSANGEIVDYRLKDVPLPVKDALGAQRYALKGEDKHLLVSFSRPGLPETVYLTRTHPWLRAWQVM
ncbi:helicase-related protein [Dictyobacter kobayashii]|nr:helicase-related protein [Dictyobacter kobayashii]